MLDEQPRLALRNDCTLARIRAHPKINNKAGRDHWGEVYSTVLAGGGIVGGQVYGASGRILERTVNLRKQGEEKSGLPRLERAFEGRKVKPR